jgi:hypothetical protein
MIRRIGIFVLLTVFSPWIWLLVLNPRLPLLHPGDGFKINSHIYLTQINTFRSQAEDAHLGLLSKLLVNKYTWSAKEGVWRMLESFDPHFLFLEGDFNDRRSTGKSGLVYLSLLLPIISYLSGQDVKKRLQWVALLLLATLPSVFFNEHFYSPAKIPMFIVFNWLACLGIVAWLRTPNALMYAYFLWLGFEAIKFFHQYFLHYLK